MQYSNILKCAPSYLTSNSPLIYFMGKITVIPNYHVAGGTACRRLAFVSFIKNKTTNFLKI